MPNVATVREPRAVRIARDVHVNTLLLANRSLDALEEICQAEGITHQQYVALWILCLADDPDAGIPVGAVADGLLNRASDTTRLIDRLEKAGLAERLPNPADRRSVLVRATTEGQRVFAAVTPTLQEFHRRQWANLTAAEVDALHGLLAKALWGEPRVIPTSDVDLYDDAALTDPYEHYRRLRDLGPVVHLTAHDVFAVARDAEVRAVLEQPSVFASGQGVGLNEFINDGGRGTTLMSDGDEHRRLRAVIGRPLTPKALADLRPEAQELADRLADRVVARGGFDAVPDLAEVLPATWVPDLLGWPDDGRDRLLDWAGATFDCLGPINARTIAGGEALLEMSAYAQQVATSTPPPGSMAAGIIDAAARGDLRPEQCPMAIIDYLGPSLDTTIAALGNAVWLFATNPEQWDRLRREPERVKQAVNEVLRIETPISGFTRVTTEPTELAGVELPAGARVLVSFASANRDERRWDAPEVFDITRNSAGHVGFGHGEHACVGMGLARLEAAAVLSASSARVARFELTGPPVRKLNNLIRSFASLPVVIHPA